MRRETLVVNAIERNICSLSLKCECKLSVLNPSVLQPGCIMVLLRTCENCVFLKCVHVSVNAASSKCNQAKFAVIFRTQATTVLLK